MTQTIHPITRERHANKKWLRAGDLNFAATASIAPLSIAEVLAAARVFPIGFVDLAGKLSLVAILGLKPGQNLFVGPNGRWLAQHVPVTFQYYPFSLGHAGDQNVALCVDEASGLVRDTAVGEDGVPFFDDQNNPSPDTKRVLDQLAAARKGFEVIERSTAAIEAKNLLEPWPINYKEDGADRSIGGIKRVSEAALNALGAEELRALRDAGGLAIAYCQLFSMGNVAGLAQLMGAHSQIAKQRMKIPEHSFVPKEDDSLKIDWDSFLKDM